MSFWNFSLQLGVHLVRQEVHLLLLKIKRAGVTVEDAQTILLSADSDDLLCQMTRVVRKNRWRGIPAIISMPDYQVYQHLLELPAGLAPKLVTKQIQAELKRTLVKDSAELSVTVHPVSAKQKGYQRLLVTATRLSSLQYLMRCIQQCGLRLLAIEPESQALWRLARWEDWRHGALLYLQKQRGLLVTFSHDEIERRRNFLIADAADLQRELLHQFSIPGGFPPGKCYYLSATTLAFSYPNGELHPFISKLAIHMSFYVAAGLALRGSGDGC